MFRLNLVLLVIFISINLSGQKYDDLVELEGYSIKTYFSPGNEERAKEITERCEKALEYGADLTGFKPDVPVFILNPEHWKKYGTHPIYGMAHYTDDHRLVVASQDNDFWRSFIPPLDKLPADLASDVKKAYSDGKGNLSMRAFFDLLALHELGHGFHVQGGLTMQRLWMQELFVNIMLHTYIAENEPENLLALETFPEMVVAMGKDEYKFTTLADFEKRYDRMDGKNYGWYQCRLHSAAKNIYNKGGEESFLNLWNVLKNNKNKMSDEELVDLLNDNLLPEVAEVQTEW